MPILAELLAFVKARRAQSYLVGGTVRDTLLGRDRYDIDVTVTGDAIATARAFADVIRGAFYVMDDEFDVARILVEQDGARQTVDFARMRGETIEQDLATRDFSINAMAFDISGGTWVERDLIDPFNGHNDLDARRIRAVSKAVFDNDPVRLLRAVRFEASLGFVLDAATETLVRHEARKLVDAPPERVRDEFYKIISAESCARHIRRFDDLGLLQFVLPEVAELKGVAQPAPHTYDVFTHTLHTLDALEQVQRGGYLDLAEGAFATQLSLHLAATVSSGHTRGNLLRIGTLLHDIGKPIVQTSEPGGRIRFAEHEHVGPELAERTLRRLRFSNDEIHLLTTIIAEHMQPLWLAGGPMTTDLAVYRYFRATGDAGVDLAVHAWCDLRARSAEVQPFEVDAALQAVIARLLDRYYHARDKVVDPPVLLNGREVIDIGEIPQGPLVGKCMEALREAQATGQVMNREQAMDFVKHWRPGA
ncbi:MAG: HDIG domain-containing metalloprotein [Anaerolineae bacterium]